MRLLIAALLVLLLALPATGLAQSSVRGGSVTAAKGAATAAKKGKKRKGKRRARPAATRTGAAPVVKSEAKGPITALSATSITVGGLTCAIPAGAALPVLAVGDVVELTCVVVAGEPTLRKVERDDQGEDGTADEREVKGPVTALSATSISVGDLTCAIPAGKTLAGLVVGDVVELKCDLVAGVWTLRKVEREDDGQPGASTGDDSSGSTSGDDDGEDGGGGGSGGGDDD